MSFYWAVRADFVTRHVMHEHGVRGPIHLYMHFGYELFAADRDRYEAILRLYDEEIRKTLKEGIIIPGAFKYREINQMLS